MNITVDGYNIEYKTSGTGPAILILQGWGTTMEVYDSIASWLSADYQVFQLNLPGFGGSDEPKQPWDVDAYTDFVLRLIGQLGIDSLSLIGHSYGGRIIIKLLSRRLVKPQIDKVVLIDSAGIKAKLSAGKKMKVSVYKMMKKASELSIVKAIAGSKLDTWKANQGSADYRAATPIMKKCMVMAITEDLTNLLPEITQDTLLIWGDRDTATPIGDGKIMDRLIPKSGLVTIKGAGHYSFLDSPAICCNVLRSYFNIKS